MVQVLLERVHGAVAHRPGARVHTRVVVEIGEDKLRIRYFGRLLPPDAASLTTSPREG
jgi:hypothetical protein